MDEIIEILKEVRDDVDFENCTSLIDDGILESFDIIQIVAALNSEFDIEIPATQIMPSNFNSAKAISAMVDRLMDE